MSQDALFLALSQGQGVLGVEGALRKLDPDDTRVGERLWDSVRSDARAVARHPAAWRFLSQAPPEAFSAADLNAFFRALSRVDVPQIDPAEGRIPWDPSFDTMIAKLAGDRSLATLDDDVEPPIRAAVRLALVRHEVVQPDEWGEDTAKEWLETLLPVWDRYPGYAAEFVGIWRSGELGQLAMNVASRPDTELRTTEFLTTFSPYADPEERLRIVLNIAAPEAMERALAVLEDEHRAILAIIFGTEKRWYERITEDFGSPLVGPHGLIGGPGLLGLVFGFAAARLFEVRFAVFLLVVAATFVAWRLALSLFVRPQLPWRECRPLASSSISRGLVAGWIAYRRSLAKKPYDEGLLDDFFDGLYDAFPEMGRPSRLRTVIEVNLQQLDVAERTRQVLRIFHADDSIERWGLLEFCPTREVAEAAIEATSRFEKSPRDGVIAAAPPVAQEALSRLAAHQQELFLAALDEGVGAEEVLVFAIGRARGDGVLDSLGRKLGQGSDAMRDAVVTALSNYGPAATNGVEEGLASDDVTTRLDAAEVAWRLPHQRSLTNIIRQALADEADAAVASTLRSAAIRQGISRATDGIEPTDLSALSEGFDRGLSALASLAERTGLVQPEPRWISGPAMSSDAARGLGFLIDSFDGRDARLLPLLNTISRHLELADRDLLGRRLFEADVDILAAICVAGPAATLGLKASTDTIEALARMGSSAALIRLEEIAFDDPDPGLRRRAFRRLHRASEARGIPVADLFERAVLELPSEATIDRAVSDRVESQAARVLHEAMVAGHRWPMERWRHLWADSPLFQKLVGRLVWAIYDYGILKRTFRLDESGEPVDIEDEPVKLERFTEIGIPVPSALESKLRRRWSLLFADYEILSPFPQLDRPVEPRSIDGLVLDGAMLRALLEDGWYPSTPGLERHYGFLRPFPRLGLTASLEISPGVGEDAGEPQTVDTLAFVDGIHSEFPSISRPSRDVPTEARIQVVEELCGAARTEEF